jgi:hypothetical protein
MVTRIFTLIVSIFFCVQCIAQSALDYTINPKRGGLRTKFTLSITAEGDASTPELEDENDFIVRYIGPEQRVSIINGSITQEKTFRYQATPKQEGTLKLPRFRSTVNGITEVTPPLTIEVSQASLDTQQVEQDDVRLEDTVSKDTIYEGEQVLLTTELMTTSPLQNIQIQKSSRPNFWSEEIKPEERDQDLRRGATVSILRFKTILFPLTSGQLTIDPTVLSAQASRSKMGDLFDSVDPFSNNFMRGFFSLDLEPVTLATKATKLTVLPLPPLLDSEKKGTLPVVITGSTSIRTGINKSETDPNNEAILSVSIETEGNGNLLNNLTLQANDSFEAVRDNQKLTPSLKNNTVLYSYTAQFRIVPKVNGSFEIPAQQILFFDPLTKTYQKASSDPIALTGVNVAVQPKKTAITPDDSIDANSNATTTPTASLIQEDSSSSNHVLWIYILSGVIAFLLFRLWRLQKNISSTNQNKDKKLIQKRQKTDFTDPKSFLSYLDRVAKDSYGGTCSIRGFLERKLSINNPQLPEAIQALNIIEEAVYAPDPAVNNTLFIESRDILWEIIGK